MVRTRRARAPDAGLRCSTARSCALDEDGRATFSAMQQGKEGTTYLYVAFDLLEVEGDAAGRPAADRAARAARGARRHAAARHSASPPRSTTAQALLRGGAASNASRGSWPSAPTRATSPGRRSRNWLKVKTQGRQELVDRGVHEGTRASVRRFRRARARRARERCPPLGGERRHRLHRRRDRPAARAACRPLEAPDGAVSRGRRCRRCGRATSSGSSRSSSRRSEFVGVDA